MNVHTLMEPAAMPKTVLYIATSLDGHIARPDGGIDWLTSFPAPESGDYGYAAFLSSLEATVMGRKTYEEIITIIPSIIGEGIPLFPGKPAVSNWKLIEAKAFDNAAVSLTYDKEN